MAVGASDWTRPRPRSGPASGQATAFLLGASLPLLGLSLGTVAGSGVQPALAAAVLHLLTSAVRRGLRLRAAPLIWATASAASMLLAVQGPLAAPKAWSYFAAAAGALGLYAFAIGDVLAGPASLRAFGRGLVGCAAASAALAVGQALYSVATGGAALTLAANPTFTISSQPYRGSAFAPEASLLFPHLALALLLVLSRSLAAELGLSGRSRAAAALVLAAGLLATRSSSLLWFAPLLVAYYLKLAWRGEASGSQVAVFALALAAAGAVFAATYGARLGADDADVSAAIRLAKIQAALAVFGQHPWLGAGLGTASDPQVIGANLPAWFVATSAGQMTHAGVDSTFARTAMEQGALGLAVMLAPFARAAAALGARPARVGAVAAALLATGVSFALAVGYRDVPLNTALSLWMLRLDPSRRRSRASGRYRPDAALASP